MLDANPSIRSIRRQKTHFSSPGMGLRDPIALAATVLLALWLTACVSGAPGSSSDFPVASSSGTTSLSVTSVSPSTGATGGGTSATIDGSGFESGVTVEFGGKAATNVSLTSSSQIQATTPSHSAGTVDVTVTNPGGASATLANGFTYQAGVTPPPTVSSVSPTSGPTAGGTNVNILGADFISGATVVFGGLSATNVVVSSATQIQAVTPAHLAGTFGVTVTNPDLQSDTLANAFSFTGTSPSPTISSVSPTVGPAAGGTLVTIKGANFASGATVSFGGSAAAGVTVISISEVRAVTPAHAAGTVGVTVTNPGGTSGSLASAFTFQAAPAPTISSVSPTSGPVSGGTNVTISGSNFQGGASVTFGGSNAAVQSIPNSNTINVVAPTHSAGTVSVKVSNPDGQSATLLSAYTFTHVVTLTWDPSPSVVSGYNAFRATVSGGPYTKINSSLITATNFKDFSVQSGVTYFYVVRAVGTNSAVSDPSNEAVAVIPIP